MYLRLGNQSTGTLPEGAGKLDRVKTRSGLLCWVEFSRPSLPTSRPCQNIRQRTRTRLWVCRTPVPRVIRAPVVSVNGDMHGLHHKVCAATELFTIPNTVYSLLNGTACSDTPGCEDDVILLNVRPQQLDAPDAEPPSSTSSDEDESVSEDLEQFWTKLNAARPRAMERAARFLLSALPRRTIHSASSVRGTVVCFSFFFWLRVLDKAEYSAFESTTHVKLFLIVSYRNYDIS